VHGGGDEIVPETEVQEISDGEQIGQRQVDVPQRSLGYDSCRHFVNSYLIYRPCVQVLAPGEILAKKFNFWRL